ncbi:MAG: DUF5009 domain-containing protein [Rhodothermales bacterium]|nr:DUF5009 domain-containing protein [Rhodothermales bacterium]
MASRCISDNRHVKIGNSVLNASTIDAGESGRFVSLDAFRGLTIAGMILVNTPGSWSYVYAPLRHAEWHGATPTDLVFPFFLFIVGTAMAFSFRKYDFQLSRASTRKVLRRVILIFVIGFLLGAFPFTRSFADLRIPGVLQRIAVAYGLASVICLTIRGRKLVATSAILLLLYWLLLVAFGGSDPYSVETNLVRKIDLAVFGASHLYTGFGIPFDPEGLLSTIPSAVTVLIGFLVGSEIRTSDNITMSLLRMLLFGTALIALGLVWAWFMPINKPLWTSSYVLYTAGIATCTLAWFAWIIDVRGLKSWSKPLVVFGMNPLFAYVLSILWVKVMLYIVKLPVDGESVNGYRWLFTRVFEPLAGPMFGSLLFAVAHVVVIWGIVRVMYARKIFVKI